MTLLRQLFPLAAIAGLLTSSAFTQTPGSLDPSFETGTGVNAGSHADVAIGSDGKTVIIGGSAHWGKIMRLNPDGSVDRGFNTGTAFGQIVDEAPVCVVVQSDKKVLVGGFFRFFDNSFRRGIVRLNVDGTVDASFDPGLLLQPVVEFDTVAVTEMALQADGKIIAGGRFRYTDGDGVSRVNLVRFNSNGTIDATFKPALDLPFGVEKLAPGAAGQVVVNYGQNNLEGQQVFETVRLLSSGARDPDFNDGAGATIYAAPFGGGEASDSSTRATALEVLGDGAVLVGGAVR